MAVADAEPRAELNEAMKMNTIRLAALWLLVPAFALAITMADVQRIYIGKISGPDGDRFQLLVAAELVKHGFTVVEEQAAADAVLTGAESTVLRSANNIAVHATMQLKDFSGGILWQKDISPKTSLSARDPFHSRAIDIAEQLQKARRQSKPAK
jgi:hypothetical protein